MLLVGQCEKLGAATGTPGNRRVLPEVLPLAVSVS
jgi:hypothetical protein